jgi:hypothetical protein
MREAGRAAPRSRQAQQMNHTALLLLGLALLPPAVQARSLKRSSYTSRARQGAWKIATYCQPWKSRSRARRKTTSPGTANELLRAVQTSDSRVYGSYTGSPSRPVGSPLPY